MTAVDALFNAALELNDDERLELTQRLISACGEAEVPPPGWWETVKPEVEATLDRVRRGEEKTHTWPEARARIQERVYAPRD